MKKSLICMLIGSVLFFAPSLSYAEVNDTISPVSGLLAEKIWQTIEELAFKPKQKKAVKQILRDYKDQIEFDVENVAKARLELFETIHSETFDEAEVRAAASTVAEAEAEFAVVRAQVIYQILAELSPEQQQLMTKKRHQAIQAGTIIARRFKMLFEFWLS